MAWRFDKKIYTILSNTKYSVPILENSSDYSPTEILLINNEKFYQALSNSIDENFIYKKIYNTTSYYYKKNRCKVIVDYDVSNYYPTTGVTIRQFKIKKISFEYPLPVKTSGSYEMPANAKSQSGSYLTTIQGANNVNTAIFGLNATYNNVTVSGSGTLDASKTSISFYLS
jgi:hypothetical protein